MKIFITGASGFIGSQLALKLAGDNHEVFIILRDLSKAAEYTSHGITVIQGDISDKAKLKECMKSCDWVFHLAAYTRPVSKDPELPYRTNVTGTLNVLEAAKEESIKKIVITSTAGTLGYSHDGKLVEEATSFYQQYHTEYERTKAISEKMAMNFNSDNMEVIVVNPTRVYGPGKLSISNSVTKIIELYGKGLWRIIPGDGHATGNYVFIDDVITGIILAAMNGRGGERYILGGENLTYLELFSVLGDVYGRKRWLVSVKEPLLKKFVKQVGMFSRITNKPAFITNDWIEKYLRNWIVSSKKAEVLLNYKITPFRIGANETVKWLKTKKN
jgi:nucleoside-diphosphate-sugar epimerase